MLKNYFKLAWRSLFKNKLYSVIILSGLALAYTACILIYLHVSDELSYDRYHENGDRIYRVVKDFVNDDGTFLPDATTPPALAPAILKEIPEVEEAVRLMPGWGNKYLVRRGDKTFFEELRYRGDSAVLKVFTFTFLEGNPDKALSKPENVIISKKMADKYFGHESPIGKNIEIGEGDSKLKVVTAVISDIPDNSHFHFDFLMAMPSQSVEWSSDWGWYNWYTYIKLKSGANIKDVETKIVTLFKKNNPESKTRYYTQALSDIHLNSKLKWELEPNGDATFVKIFIIVGIFIILIAAVNYINLSIAQGLSRSKEVGIRKVSGAFGVRLITQFLAESVLISMLAAIVAIALVELVLPSLNDQFQKNILPVSRQPFEILAGIMALAFLLGTISGFYPSLYLSAFKPVQVLKGAFQTGNRSLWLRKGLVIVQFTISIALITGTILVVRQVNYLRSKDLGFDKDHVVVVQNAQYVQQKVAM
ncbi:MAG: ABC transporter permease, partial [Bacteroidota bacterium]